MKRRNTWRPWLDPVGLVARLLLAVIALSTAIEVLEATASLREERLSVLGISAVGELDLILGLLMLVSGTLVLAGLWTRAAVIGVLLTWWPSFLMPKTGPIGSRLWPSEGWRSICCSAVPIDSASIGPWRPRKTSPRSCASRARSMHRMIWCKPGFSAPLLSILLGSEELLPQQKRGAGQAVGFGFDV